MLKLISLAALFMTGFYFWPKSASTMKDLPEQMAIANANMAVSDPQPEELGQVHWLRDLKAGRAEATKTGKPLLLLFQEVPGCSNCTHFGNNTLSHPLIAEAIETYFVPVCIYNNKGGTDAEALQTFNEPAWNNPVVRIVRADYQDVVLRIPDFRTSLPLVNSLRRALELTGTAVPALPGFTGRRIAGKSSWFADCYFLHVLFLEWGRHFWGYSRRD